MLLWKLPDMFDLGCRRVFFGWMGSPRGSRQENLHESSLPRVNTREPRRSFVRKSTNASWKAVEQAVSSSQYDTTTSDYERRKDQKIVILTLRISEKGMTGKGRRTFLYGAGGIVSFLLCSHGSVSHCL